MAQLYAIKFFILIRKKKILNEMMGFFYVNYQNLFNAIEKRFISIILALLIIERSTKEIKKILK